MPLILSGNVASAAAGAYEVANSCMFNAADSVRLYKTGSTGNRRTWTWSCWLKRCTLGGDGDHLIFGASSDDFSTDYLDISFTSADKINIQDYQGSEALRYLTTRVFRDVSAWMNIVIRVDTTQGTASNRLRIYINGVEETAFDTETDPSEDAELLVNKNVVHQVGGRTGAYGGLYMAECVLIDGSSLAPTSFGEFNEDSPNIWQPIDVSGLTFGTNGFYCDYEASDNLGNDANGGTDLTEANLAAIDQATDTPTNSFATLNPLIIQGGTAPTMTEGNLKITIAGSFTQRPSTMVVNKGKWYAEVFMHTLSSSGQYATFGITGVDDLNNNHQGFAGSAAQGMIIALDNRDNQTLIQSSDSTILDPNIDPTDDDIVGMALDLDNGKMYFHLNGTYVNSGDPTSGATGTGAVDVPTADIDYFITYGVDDSVISANFGGTSVAAISSGNADGNGYGNFEFAVPANYYSLCTKNLAEYG